MGSFTYGFKDLDGGPTKDWYTANYFYEFNSLYMDLAFAKRPYEELYDLENDPWEIINLAQNDKFRDILKQLSGQLDEILISTGDPRMTGNGDTYDHLPFTIPIHNKVI